MAEKMSIDKKEPSIKDDSDESLIDSSGEQEQGQSVNNTQESQQPKKKGGRKPIYATSEERKQRNRQAQAAFRERRTEYIKQLEESIRAHEASLQNLQAAHRSAAEECLLLRYKNSLLERILLVKGIDVQAELQEKTGSPNLGPTHAPQPLIPAPIGQRAMINRHHQSRRSNSSIAPKLEPGVSPLPPPIHPHSSVSSPKNRPTPPSHSNSPTNTGASYSQTPVSPTTSDNVSFRTSNPTAPKPMTITSQPGRPPLMQAAQEARVAANYSLYQQPGFQNHLDQLDQEYDAQADMMDDSELETTSGPGPYPANFGPDAPQPMHIPPATTGPPGQLPPAPVPGEPYQMMDSSVDWDPFGLSASMAFPNTYTYDQNNLR